MPITPSPELEPKASPLASPPRREAVSAPPVHLEYLDGLRALAALAVVMCHCLLPGWHEWPLGVAITSKLRLFSLYDNLGHFAVNLFIVLSGFCLMLPVVRHGGLKGGASVFLKKRAVRILPSYYLASGFSLILIATLVGHKTGTQWDHSIPVTEWNVLANILLLQNFTDQPGAINHVYWSISLEWWIYFLFPALIFAGRRLGEGIVFLGAMVLSLLLVGGCTYLFGRGFTLQYVGLFAMGVFAATLVKSDRPASRHVLKGVNLASLSVLTLVILALCRYGPGLLGGNWSSPLLDYVVGLWVSCLLILLVTGRLAFLRYALSFRPIVFIGTFAYSIYLTHAPIVQVLWEYGIAPLHLSHLHAYLLFKVLALPLSIGVGYGFYLLCERPFVRAKQHVPEILELSPKMKSRRLA